VTRLLQPFEVAGEPLIVPGASQGPLIDLRFGIKDVFDVQGHQASCGNPDWQRTHPPAAQTAPVVQRLLDAGATLDGRYVLDERHQPA
jgi:amidase